MGLRNSELADAGDTGDAASRGRSIPRLLAISDSLRSVSSNSAVLRAARLIAAPELEIDIYEGLDTLPHFNPDLDVDAPPAVVAELRRMVGAADGLIISSPLATR